MKKKICFIVSSPATINAFMLDHIKVLSKDFDIFVVANLDQGSINDDIEAVVKNIRIERSISLIQDLKALYYLSIYLKENSFDVIHTITPKAGLIGQLAGFFTGTKHRIHIFTGQVWATSKGIKKEFLKKIDKLIGALTTLNLLDGYSQRDFMIENKILTEGKAKVLGSGSISGVNLERFSPNLETRKYLRKKYNIIEDEQVILYLGRLNIDKGVIDLINAFLIVKEKINNCKLLIVGPDEEGISKKYYGLEPSIVFTGSVKNPEEILQIADIFCLPSYREGFGTSVIEASALEIPVLVSDAYGLRDTIIDQITGFRHKVADVQDIANKLIFMLEHKETLKDLGIEGRKYVSQKFDSKILSKLLKEFYSNLFN